MAKILVAYYSRGGNTRKMAEAVAAGAAESGLAVTLREVMAVNPDELLAYAGIIVGSPTYYGTLAWEVKKMFDDSVKHHRKLEGKVGAAFSTNLWRRFTGCNFRRIHRRIQSGNRR